MCSGLLPVLGIYMTLDYVNVRHVFNLKIPILIFSNSSILYFLYYFDLFKIVCLSVEKKREI